MPPRMARRGSVALSMLDNQSLAPRLESVLSSVNPPSEDAAFQAVDSVLTAAIWRSHRVVLDNIARACGAHRTTLGLLQLMGMTNEFLVRDSGKDGPIMTNLQIDEPMPCEIDVRARGRIGTHGWNVTQPLDGDSLSDDMSDDISCASSSGMSARRGGSPINRNNVHEGGDRGGALESLADLPLAEALSIRKVPGGNRGRSLSRHDSGMMTGRSEGPSTSRSIASSARLAAHPAMARLFDMADRRHLGWLNVTDLQVFLEYHGHKQWANQTFIRTSLFDLGISKAGNEPITQHHFLRFLFFLMQKDPLMEFAARPLPPDELSIGVPEQARELAAILKEAASRNQAKPVAARRRLNRALTSQLPLNQQNAPAPGTASAGAGAGADRDGGGGAAGGWDKQRGYQVAPHVNVRDLVVARRPSTAPAAGGPGGNRRQQQQQKQPKRGKQGIPGDDGARAGAGGNNGLDAFLSLDHSVQASLVETVTDVRPGVTVQEMGFPEEGEAAAEGSGRPEVVRMKAGPAELQIPGKLSRSAYKALSNSRIVPETPMGLDRPSTTPNPGKGASDTPGGRGAGGAKHAHPLKSGVAGMRGGIRSSTAPLGLHGFFGVKDGPDPRLLGGSKVSAGYDGDDGNDGGRPRKLSGSISERALPSSSRALGGGPSTQDDDGLSTFFVGEDIGSSSIPRGVQGAESHTPLPRGARPMSSASGATRARVSSPGLGVRGDKRGGRAVAAW